VRLIRSRASQYAAPRGSCR